MIIRIALLSFVLTGTLSACSQDEQRACQPARDDWRRPQLTAGLDPVSNKVTIGHNEQAYWNGAKVSDVELAALLNEAKSLEPKPDVYLEAEMGVPCERLEQVRDEMSEALDCRGGNGPCVEGLPNFMPRPF